MKAKLISIGSAVVLGLFASAVHAEPSFNDKDRSELYRVFRQQNREIHNGYYAREPRYYHNKIDDLGPYEQYRPYEERRSYDVGRRYRYYGE